MPLTQLKFGEDDAVFRKETATASACRGRISKPEWEALLGLMSHGNGELTPASYSEQSLWLHGLRVPGISPILRLIARPEASRVKSTFNPVVAKNEVALDGNTSYLG